MKPIYVVEDDTNIREIELFALKTAGMIQRALSEHRISGKVLKVSSRRWSCWILCCRMRTDWQS